VLCRILSFHSCDITRKSNDVFQRNILPPYAGLKSKPNSAACFILVSYLLTLKPWSLSWYFAPKIRPTFAGLHGLMSQKLELITQFLVTGTVRLSPASSLTYSQYVVIAYLNIFSLHKIEIPSFVHTENGLKFIASSTPFPVNLSYSLQKPCGECRKL
jgi:hypothetical protein